MLRPGDWVHVPVPLHLRKELGLNSMEPATYGEDGLCELDALPGVWVQFPEAVIEVDEGFIVRTVMGS